MTIKRFLLKIRRLLTILMHVIIVAGAYILAFYLRFEFKLPAEYLPLILKTLPILLMIKLITFYYFGLLAGLWKYVSMEDLWQILKANLISTGIFVLYVVFFIGLVGYPRSIFIFDWGLCVGLMSGLRFLTRGLKERVTPVKYDKNVRVLIVGAGEAGILVYKELKKNMSFDIVEDASDHSFINL